MKAKQKKNTVALVITIIELVAILGVYLSIGTAMGLSLAREQGWICGLGRKGDLGGLPTPLVALCGGSRHSEVAVGFGLLFFIFSLSSHACGIF